MTEKMRNFAAGRGKPRVRAAAWPDVSGIRPLFRPRARAFLLPPQEETKTQPPPTTANSRDIAQTTHLPMLDQSFSARNFEEIYQRESRRGKIGLHFMPSYYTDIIGEAERCKRDLAEMRRRGKSARSTEENERVGTLRERLKTLAAEKQQALERHMRDIETNVADRRNFRLTLTTSQAHGKEVFVIGSSHAEMFVVKQLQRNIRRTFKTKQADRHHVMASLKSMLDTTMPLYVIRTDITAFYESIPRKQLLAAIEHNTLLSQQSRVYVRAILSEFDKMKSAEEKGVGIPRGVGISAYLSELYLGDIDRKLRLREEVVFYARYVDDIIIVLSHLPEGTDIAEYYDKLRETFAQYGLTLKAKGDDKCALLDISKGKSKQTFSYLGYNVTLCREKSGKHVSFSLSDAKKDKIKRRIDRVISHFERLARHNAHSAAKDLRDGLNRISANIALRKTKEGVKTGLYYSSNLLDDLSGLDELTEYLHGKTVRPFAKTLGEHFDTMARERIDAIDFRQRWEERKIYRFSTTELNNMRKWL